MNSTGLAAWGGGEKWMLQTGLELRGLGHTIYYGGRDGSLFLNKCETEGFRTLALRVGSDFDPFTIKKISAFLKENQIDIIIVGQNKDVRLAGLACKISPNRVVVAHNGLPSIKNNFRYRMLYPKLLDGIMVTTNAIKQKYLSYKWLDESFISVIKNGIFPIPVPPETHTEIKKRYDIPENRPIIGIFGKLNKSKQHTIFLEVAAAVHTHFSDALFLIVGDGPERENLQHYAFDLGILDHIYMTGFQDNPFPLYAICDVVLLTSQEEGLPNVVMEAMLMEKPVIAFDVGGVSELIISEKNGILIPPNDIYLMTQRVEQLLIDRDIAVDMGKCAREHTLTRFGVEHMISELETYLKTLVRKKRGVNNGS